MGIYYVGDFELILTFNASLPKLLATNSLTNFENQFYLNTVTQLYKSDFFTCYT